MDGNEVSEHGTKVDRSPEGWNGGDLIHTGGNIHAREWVHPENQLRVGYSIENPNLVGVEEVRYDGDGERTNPRMWQRVSDVESEPCDGESDCLDTAIELMKRLNERQ